MKKYLVLFIVVIVAASWYVNQKHSQEDYDSAVGEMDSIIKNQAIADTLKAHQLEENSKQKVQKGSVEGLEIPIYESSRGGQMIKHIGYTLSYDADFKTPQWVAWELTKAEVQGQEPRANRFLPDPDIRGAKAYHSDYINSGYDRGHIAPAGDMKWSKQAMKESFYMSNICPQNRNLNKGDWKDLEELERTWAEEYGSVFIAAGPIYTSNPPKRIGANKVAVPNAFFKVLLVGYPNSPKAYGFIFNNQAGSHPLSYYQLTVDEVEEQTGMDFFSSLPNEVENAIEANKPSL